VDSNIEGVEFIYVPQKQIEKKLPLEYVVEFLLINQPVEVKACF